MTTFVGIDGGGTSSRAVVTDAAGRILGRVEGGPALVRASDPAAGASALADLVDRALRAAGVKAPAEAVCCALAGAGRADAQRELSAAMIREAIALRVRVVTDAEAAFHDAFGHGPGILLVAGTGSIAWGRGEAGELARAGGWGERLDDEGSAFAIGRDALRAILRAHDGRAQPTALAEAILPVLGLDSPDGLVAWAARAEKNEVAALAPRVLEVAGRDGAAREIVGHAALELAALVAALHDRLGPWPEPPRLALTGGLIAPGRPLREPVIEQVQRRGMEPRVLAEPVDAARGAATLARESAV